MFPEFISDKNIILDELLILKSDEFIPYPQAIEFMESYVEKIRKGGVQEAIWFLEHPPIYTAGTSAKSEDLLFSNGFPVYETGRGGQYTYHGPKQLVAYIMVDLQKRKFGVKEFVKKIETLIISALAEYDLTGHIREGRVGVWIDKTQTMTNSEDKIAAIGIRIRKGVSFHGFAVNLAPNLQHFSGIIPCGLSEYGVTSLEKLHKNASRSEFESNIIKNLQEFIK